ncbi:hypothetical protein MRX96_008534 [Rhipicephalus microplus]
MQELFNPTYDESTSAVNSDPDEPHQPSEEDHWQITRIALERALPRISASTATGLVGIPAGLVKRLGKSAREHLAGIFNTILRNGPIPPDWQCGRVSLVCKRGGDAGLLGDFRPITSALKAAVEVRDMTFAYAASQIARWFFWRSRSLAVRALSKRCAELASPSGELTTFGAAVGP